MRNTKRFSVLFVLGLYLFISQSTLAQKAGDVKSNIVLDNNAEQLRGNKKLAAQKTQAIMSNIVRGKRAEILKTDESDQLFLVNVGKPAINILKDSSNPDKTEFWYLVVKDEAVENVPVGTVIEASEPALPKVFSLSQNYPNPFNPSTTIKFQLPEKNGTSAVRTVLRVYDILGRVVRTLVDEDLAAGFYTKRWDGLNDDGVRISSGVYFYSITAGDFRKTKKMLLLK